MANRKRYIVRTNVGVGGFTKPAIDEMKMLAMIEFVGSRQISEGTIYEYRLARPVR